jgi:hypothetical protein
MTDLVGFAVWLDREDWGHVMDGLILSSAEALQRKAANLESTSDVRAQAIADLIRRLGEAALAGDSDD